MYKDIREKYNIKKNVIIRSYCIWRINFYYNNIVVSLDFENINKILKYKFLIENTI